MLLIISKNYGFIENYAVRAEIENQILTIIANEKFLFKSVYTQRVPDQRVPVHSVPPII